MYLVDIPGKNLMYFSGCDKCTEWYHGDCINLRKSEAKNVKEWYCQMCLGRLH